MNTPYRYSIKRETGVWYGTSGRDVITQSTPFYYYGFIANWNELGIRDSRNMRLGGFFRNRTSELQFVRDLALIMRHADNTDGVNQELTLYVDRFNTTLQAYEPDGNSVLNFAQARDERDQVAVYLMEGGVPELIKTNENTKYDIPVTGSEVVNVKVLPQLVRGISVFSSITPQDQSPVVPNRPTDVFNMIGYAQTHEEVFEVLNSPNYRPVDYFDVMATNLAMSGGAATSMELGQPYQEWPDLTNGIVKIVNTTSKKVDYLIKANVTLEKVSVKGEINVYLKNTHGSSSVDFKVNFYESLITGGAPVLKGGSSNTVTLSHSSDGVFTFAMNETNFSLAAGSVLYVTLQNLTPSITQVEYMTEGSMVLMVEFQHRVTEYTTSGYNALTLLRKVLDKITNSAVPVNSKLLSNVISYAAGIDCRPDKLQITSTKCLQGLSNPNISISLNELLTSLSIWLGCGLAVLRDAVTKQYNEVRIEEWDYFYKEEKSAGVQNLIADFSSVADYSIENAEDMMFSKLRIGYEATDVDSRNVTDDVHATLEFTSSYTKVESIKEMISPIQASPFALYQEHFRGFSTKGSTTQSNNKTYVIQYNPTQVAGVHTALYPADINPSASITGITDPTRLLNPGITPKRCLIRSAHWLLSHMSATTEFITDKYMLTYSHGERNPNLVSKIGTSLAVGEKTDFDLASAPIWTGKQRLFYPKYLFFTAPSLRNYKALWEANRFGVFTVKLSFLPGTHPRLTCYPLESADWTANNDTYDFKALLTASNNLTVLIR